MHRIASQYKCRGNCQGRWESWVIKCKIPGMGISFSRLHLRNRNPDCHYWNGNLSVQGLVLLLFMALCSVQWTESHTCIWTELERRRPMQTTAAWVGSAASVPPQQASIMLSPHNPVFMGNHLSWINWINNAWAHHPGFWGKNPFRLCSSAEFGQCMKGERAQFPPHTVRSRWLSKNTYLLGEGLRR